MNMKKRVTSRKSRVASPAAAQAQLDFRSPRRGILLLVVLSMLTLFLLIGTAFIVSANQYRKANKILAKVTEASNSSVDQVNLLEEVLNQLVRDTNNQNSSLRFHSLLRDMYGNDGILAEIDVVEWATAVVGDGANFTGGQILQFLLDPATFKDQFGISLQTLNANHNAYNGLVLTFLDGPARGQSVRIVGHIPEATGVTGVFTARLRVMAPPLADGSNLTFADFAKLRTSRILINGRPFNGTGVGYNPLAAANTAKLSTPENVLGTNRLLSLMPNNAFQSLLFDTDQFDDPEVAALRANISDKYYFTDSRMFDLGIDDLTSRQQNLLAIRMKNLIGSPGQGGSDESYDAVDFQNMVLALMPTNPTELLPATIGSGVLQDAGGMLPIPSFHRPALINYWRTRLFNATPDFEPNLLRKVLLRPSWMDHPNFTGSNPEFANLLSAYQNNPTVFEPQRDLLNSMIYGPWDVDNDNDGIRDSVWVDFGAPVMENADGRLVKPMAAVLVLDMGGRLNLNAHGSADTAGAGIFGSGILAPPPQALADGASSNALPRGQGYGPAEISLAPMMPVPMGLTSASAIRRAKWRWYQRIFKGAVANDSLVPSANDLAPTSIPRNFRRNIVGKYGTLVIPSDPNPLAGNTRPSPGYDGLDIATQLKSAGMPRWGNGETSIPDGNGGFVLGGFATPPDPRGRYGLGLDALGRPVYEAVTDFQNPGTRLDADTTYELDLSLGAARGDSQTAPDGPYTVAELERVLRAYDPDAGALPSRIWNLAGEFKQSSSDTTPKLETLNLWRTTLTTDSYDLPVPSVVVPGWMVVGPNGTHDPAGPASDDFEDVMGRMPVGLTFADLLEYRIRVGINPTNPAAPLSAANELLLRREMKKLLPPDLADGLRLDINRPIGNGRDDNDNGVVDEPGEWDDIDNNHTYDGENEASYWASNASQLNAFTGNDGNDYGRFRDERILLEDRNNDNVIDAADLTKINVTGVVDTHEELVIVHNLRRQMLARDMYVLAMTLVDPLPIPTAGITDSGYVKRRAQRARQLAQWAINVVDFRDPDSIMTAFEYDVNPFDGWSPDGNLATTDDIYGTDKKIGGAAGTTNADQGGFVWGSERPELLITETLGWHDRATENTNKEDPANDEDGDNFVNDDDQGTVPLNANETTKLPDSDYDQRLRPKGAAFVELYCPWPENPANNADIHDTFTTPGTDLGVNLAAVSATHTDRPIASPCWRLMMYKDGGPGMDPDSHEVKLRPMLADRSVYFTGFDPNYPEPARYASAGRAHPDVTDAARYVNDGVAFFNGYDEITDMGDASLRVLPVRPGGYMVVGAGEESGAGPYVSKLSSPTGSVNYSPQGISLDPTLNANVVQLQDTTGNAIMDPAGFLVQANRNVAVAIINQVEKIGASTKRRFTFSEPANGYPNRVEGSRWDPNRGASGAYVPTVDIPLDDQRALFEKKGFRNLPLGTGGRLQAKKRSELNDGEIRLTLPGFRLGRGFAGNKRAGGAIGRDIEMASRTIPGFKWVYLQRLANPLLPWNPEPFLPNGTTPTPGYQASLAFNPYLTVDSMGANVTVYSGVSPEERRVDPSKPKDPILRFRNRIPIDTLSSLQRGRSNNPFKPSDPDGLAQLQEYFQERPDGKVVTLLNSSKPNEVAMNIWNPEALGYINGTVAGVWKNEAGTARNGVAPTTSNNFNGIPDHTLGFLNEPFRAAGSDPNEPKSPLSWFTWNNRPFANGGELLQVPTYRSSQLLSAYSMRADDASAISADELYEKEAKVSHRRKLSSKSRWEKLLDLQADGSYGHLLNFFRTKQTDPQNDSDSTNPSTLVDDRGIVGLFRIVDYIHVPTPFVKSETWLNPASFGNVTTPIVNVNDPRYLRQPPFNRIAEYREPGRVNINTVVSGEVWDGGILHRELDKPALAWDPLNASVVQQNNFLSDSGHSGPLFLSNTSGGLVSSRRGYGNANDSMLRLSTDTPTFFENPFRSADAFDLVPILSMLQDNSTTPTNRKSVSATALRQDEFSTAPNKPPLFAGTSTAAYNNTDRNAYFRMQPVTRLSSMTTNRSNVYAVWVTIGFFEVEEAPDRNTTFKNLNDPTDVLSNAQLQALYDKVYPEGYMLGKEAGSDTGDIRRVREFAMIDRTVPVAFEPGKNHNVDKAIRLRRRIE